MTQIVVDEKGEALQAVMAQVQIVGGGQVTVEIHEGKEKGFSRMLPLGAIHKMGPKVDLRYPTFGEPVDPKTIEPGCFLYACFVGEDIELRRAIQLPN